ncbi:hypothetical protein CYLTODRAFT_230615 [Cylindrobasidium torrendii FP15055 ss-10]|uniref:Uncharacterized protein n=1 Tax=Cylindrobasidium torrendii FP15055 ss-10 TaxID=1314674 RepID=A0A0D7BGQ6_9AGAR|nr:hypothetical protein CYLTODRAFT_230615 [Cylindrobasidium torrendii FP15055 ss-10]
MPIINSQRGRGHLFVRFAPPCKRVGYEYGLVVKYYIFHEKQHSRLRGYRCSKVIMPEDKISTVCHRFSDFDRGDKNPQRLCAMVYRVNLAPLTRFVNNVDDLPENAYLDRFSDTHCKNDCRPLITFIFECAAVSKPILRKTPRRLAPKAASQATDNLECEGSASSSDSEVEIIACTAPPSKRKRVSEAEGTESRLNLKEDDRPTRKRVKKFESALLKPSRVVQAISPQITTLGHSPSSTSSGAPPKFPVHDTRTGETVPSSEPVIDQVHFAPTINAIENGAQDIQVAVRSSANARGFSTGGPNALKRLSVEQQLDELDSDMQRIAHKKVAIIQDHIKKLEAEIKESEEEANELKRMAEQNRHERAEFGGYIAEIQRRFECLKNEKAQG